MRNDQDLDRRRLKAEIAEALAAEDAAPGSGGDAAGPEPAFRRPLLGHDSEETAYLVTDYLYGFRQRTQIRYWLEHKPKKGWRMVSQTEDPKRGRWNKPKASTYAEWGGAMYLDDAGHVQWTGIGPFSSDRDVLAFAASFPVSQGLLREVAPRKLRYLRARLDGTIEFTINGVAQPLSLVERRHVVAARGSADWASQVNAHARILSSRAHGSKIDEGTEMEHTERIAIEREGRL